MSLTGTSYDVNSMLTGGFISEVSANGDFKFEMQNGYQIIRMNVDRYGWSPDKFVLKKGIPVKWVITTTELNGCNNAISVPKLNLEFDNVMGEQVIEFTPEKEGTIPFSCWMGMIPGVLVVVDDGEDVENALTGAVVAKGGSCGSGGSGGCGCGG